MTSTPRERLSVRLGIRESLDHAPYEGVPAHLKDPLRRWIRSHFSNVDPQADEICMQLRIALRQGEFSREALMNADETTTLDVVDAILGSEDPDLGGDYEDTLARMLNVAGSAYRVNEAGDGLELRVDPAVRESVGQAVSDAQSNPSTGSGAEHLAAAWQASYGLHPDPVRAYSEAIKAVESAAHGVIQPNHARATLGTMLGEIGNAQGKFVTTLSTPTGKDPIAPVEAMMRALWDGQTSRHGKQTVTVPETLESARSAVHLAATLVQWFASGAVTRSP
ncbi:hypothetical protein AB0E78_05870 [Streptomyces sp. NPDC032198]|uniref:hypothetical protein n=1 Tax=Streptomyces sp. NPDC032198 TaxID=3155127 RepID=UPI0033FCE863